MQTKSALKDWGQPVPSARKVHVHLTITNYNVSTFYFNNIHYNYLNISNVGKVWRSGRFAARTTRTNKVEAMYII